MIEENCMRQFFVALSFYNSPVSPALGGRAGSNTIERDRGFFVEQMVVDH